MHKRLVPILVLLALVCTRTFADDLPQLPMAPEITRGTLSNGIDYYLVSNKHTPGHADFAVVQRDYTNPLQARRNLVSLTHFGNRRPCDFLSFHGVPCPRNGFVSSRSGSTTYFFPSVPVKSQDVCDSTILMLLDIASTCPGNQAIIMSGCLDVAKVKERLNLLSLAISPREVSPLEDKYVWMPSTNPSVYYSGSVSDAVSTLSVTYSSARTPLSRMNTSQPVVTRQYSTYLGSILQKRISSAFRSSGIPLVDIQYRHKDSSEGPGNELYSLTVSTSSHKFQDAVKIVAAILSDIDNRGVTSGELEDAKMALVMKASREEGNRWVTNCEYVARCVNSFLYGASLASDAVINGIFSRSALPIASELPIFNLFSAALLGPENNLTLGFATPEAGTFPELEEAFVSSWKSAADNQSIVPAVPQRSRKMDLAVTKNKTKLAEQQADAMTGGTVAKFSNGLKLICKKTDLQGEFKYSFHIKGGSLMAPVISAGQRPYLTDLLNMCEVSGMRGEEFREMLASEGINFSPEVTLSDIRIVGSAPKDKIPAVLKALSMFSEVCQIPEEEYSYFRTCETLKLSARRCSEAGTVDVLDSLLNVGGDMSPVKNAGFLTDNLPREALGFFIGQFGRFSSGVLTIMGDIDIDQLEKPVCQYLGGVTAATPVIGRPKYIATSPSGKYEVSGQSHKGPSVHCAWKFPFVFNEANHAALILSMAVLESKLPDILTPLGYSFSLEHTTMLYPQEQETIYLNCYPCSLSGLPEGVEIASPDYCAEALEKALSQFSCSALDISETAAILASEIAVESSSTDWMTEAVLTRYSVGKNINSGLPRSVLNVTQGQLQSVFKAMQSGRYVKYLIR